MNIKSYISSLIRSKGKHSFIRHLKKCSSILDIGCSDTGAQLINKFRPDINYTGIDICETNSLTTNNSNKIIVSSANNFHKTIEAIDTKYDAIVCSHNIEHCNDYINTTLAMIKVLKKNGLIYISFPCAESEYFPNNKGCINFYEDKTHKNLINYHDYIKLLKTNGLNIKYASRRYRPIIPFIIGLLFEPISIITRKLAPAGGTWALYGFETILIAQKI